MTLNIPDLPVSQMTDKDGFATAPEYQFRQGLVQSLQSVTSDEGLVPPTQDSATIAIIQNGKNPQGLFTCQAGTLIYNSDTNKLQVCILVAGVPTFFDVLHS
jgi:hypothetical protein